MKRARMCTLESQNECAVSFRAATLSPGGTSIDAAAMQPRVHAITLNMTYFNEGDPIPHDENPSWDPDGSILKSHFQAAKAIWESLLPGGGSYDFDFEWDDDLDAGELGLTSPGPTENLYRD